MSIVINDQAFERVKREAAQRLQRAAVFFVQQHTTRLSVPNPLPHTTPSKPGEYPRKRTGGLIGGVIMAPLDVQGIIDGGFKVRVGLMRNVWYGLHLEKNLDRLGFDDTREALRTQIEAILLRAIRT